MAKLSSRPYFVYVRILQNGQPVAETIKPFGKEYELEITSELKGDLAVPLYPLHNNTLKLINIEKKYVEIILNDPWEGFLTSHHQVIPISTNQRGERKFQLFEGDYGSILFNDLRLLIKIDYENKEPNIPLDARYAPRILSLAFRNTNEKLSFGIAVLITTFILGLATLGLFMRKTSRPEVFEELADSYTLPFIHEQNLSTSVEALQENLNRHAFIPSVVGFYRDFMALHMGTGISKSTYLFPSTLSRINELNDKRKVIESEWIKKQKLLDLEQNKNREIMLNLPSVIGQSIQNKILTMVNKVQWMHDSLILSYEKRVKITKKFTEDAGYDWIDYIGEKQNAKANEKPATIFGYNKKNNEVLQYKQASQLGQIAKQLQLIHDRHVNKKAYLLKENIIQLKLSPNSKLISYIKNLDHEVNDEIMAKLVGSEYREWYKNKIKEPIIGKIHVKEIESFFDKNRFRLDLCYERALRGNSKLKGTIKLIFDITTLGKVDEFKILNSELKDEFLHQCLSKTIHGWHFPKPKNGSIKISHTLLFERNKSI